jgi:ssDNA-binding Zn-finger/Zn-ribbon topoisomerase 1
MLSSNLTHASSRAIARPPCPKCGTTMVLARIAPHTLGYDMRPFECPACDHLETSVVHFGGVGESVVPLV